jgi:cardiolipin-specific phospholipase
MPLPLGKYSSPETLISLASHNSHYSFFFRNWEAIANSAAETGRRTFFLDWLGMGASSRPSPALLASPVNTPVEQRVARAEHFFLSSLESWRQEVGIEKMVLVGHSLGGYLASAYAIQYPENVSSLILVSPAGIPTVEDEKPKPIGKGPNSHPAHERVSLDAAADAVEIEMQNPKEPEKPKATFMSTALRKTFIWGWEKGLSPFSVLRGLGPWGPLLVGKYSTRRFAAQDPNDVRDLHSYIYATSVLKGSGEFCISHILKPGAYARMPIAERIHGLRMPVTFLYGDNDWMDIAGGLAVEHILNEEGNKDVQVHCVPRAGHHLYLDNPDFTNVILDLRIKSAPPVAAA